ncbi:MAG: hypothetical protein K6U03_00800, partial [Firmicutes bacterium]|nr:hypothetical protein [Bacillota bacterium]
MSPQKIGMLVVKPSPKDQPTNPDESRDLFSSTLAGVAPPRFGTPGVAILRSGYALEMRDLLASFGEPSDFILPEEFTPTAAAKYRVIIIPSAGLARVENIPNLREKFSAYVSAGGTLLVMAQPMDACYKLLPDRVESIGYYQDKACYTATAGIRKYTPALAGQSDATVDGTADGVLTSWPEGAETWLYRLKNNFPALLMYRHGNGRVIVSNYYSDYAHGHAQLHRDERALLRDLLSWARDFAEIPEVRPGGKITLNVPVTYAPEPGREAPAAKIRLILRNPDRKQVQTKDYPLELASGGTADVFFTFEDSTRGLSNAHGLGIWWVNYELYDAAGKLLQSEREGARVALSLHLEGAASSNLALTVNQALTAALEGTEIPFTILARNESDTPRTIGYRVEAVLSGVRDRIQAREVASGSITVAPYGTAETGLVLLPFKAMTSSISQSWNKNWWRFTFTDEEGKTIITEFRGVSVYKPTARVEYSFRNLTNPGAEVYQPGDRVMMDLKIINQIPLGYPVRWAVEVKAPDGTPLGQQSGEEILDPVINPVLIFSMPDDCKLGRYRIDIWLEKDGQRIPVTEDACAPLYQPYPEIALENVQILGEKLVFDLNNKGKMNSRYTLTVAAYTGGTETILETKTDLLRVGESTHFEVSLEALTPFLSHTLLLTLNAGGRESVTNLTYRRHDLEIRLANPHPVVATNSWRDTLLVTNRGGATPALWFKVEIPKLNVAQTFPIPSLAPGETVNIPLSLALPEVVTPGTYEMEFFLGDGARSGRAFWDSLTVLPPKLKVSLTKNQYGLEEPVGLAIFNEGEAETGVTYEVSLTDASARQLAKETGFLRIAGRAEETIQWRPPSNLRSGCYCLVWRLETSPIEATFSGKKAIDLTGQSASLDMVTEQPVYTPEENVGALARIANGPSYPLRGTLELEISKLSFAARPVEWPCLDGSNERTGQVTAPGAMDSAPTVLWASEILDAGPAFPPLVGDVDGDGRNEFVYLDGALLVIAEAASGHRKRSFDLAGIYPDFSLLTALLLADIDGNGAREILLCADNRFLAAVDGKAELVWARLFEEDVLSSPFMATADLTGDGRMELLLDSCVLDGRTGELVREGTELGTVADLNGDGKPEIVNAWEILDADFRLLAEPNVPCPTWRYPSLADLEGDGKKEIVLWDPESGLYVYDYSYTLLWSYALTGIREAAVGDLDGDGKKEIVAPRAVATPEPAFALLCLDHAGRLLWQRAITVEDPESMEEALSFGGGVGDEPCSLLLGDFNNDARMEVFSCSPWSGLGLYTGGNGEEIWHLPYLMLAAPAAADLEGDGRVELMVADFYNGFYVSFAGLGGRRQDPVLVARPTVEVDCYHADLGDWEKTVVMPDGTLFISGNDCLIYYEALTGRAGTVPITTPHPDEGEHVIRLGKEGIECWYYDYYNYPYVYKLLGYVHPDTKVYTECTGRIDENPIDYDPSCVLDGYYYYVYYYYYPSFVLAKKNILTGEVTTFGCPYIGAYPDIIAALDDNSLLILHDISINNQTRRFLSKISLTDLTITHISEWRYYWSPKVIKLGAYKVLLQTPFHMENSIYQYDLTTNQLTCVLSSIEFTNYLANLGYPLNCFSFIPKDQESIYLMCNNGWSGASCPLLFEYNLNTKEFHVLATLKDQAKPFLVSSCGEQIFFTVNGAKGDLYYYDSSAESITYCPAPNWIKQTFIDECLPDTINLISNSNGEIWQLVGWVSIITPAIVQLESEKREFSFTKEQSSYYLGYNYNLYYLIGFNPHTGEWQRISLQDVFGQGQFRPAETCFAFGATDDILYFFACDMEDYTTVLLEYERSSGSIKVVDRCYSSSYETALSLVFDGASNRLYYAWNNTLNCYDPNTKEVNIMGSLANHEYLLGVDDGKLYRLWLPREFLGLEGIGINFWRQDPAGEEVVPLFSSPVAGLMDIDDPLEAEALYYTMIRGSFAPREKKYYLVLNGSIVAYDLSGSVSSAPGGWGREKVIARKTVPIDLADGEALDLRAEMGRMPEPGSYTLRGKLTNELGQRIGQDTYVFYVSDNLLQLGLGTDKEYYKPGEPLRVEGWARNLTASELDGLRLMVSLVSEDRRVVIKDEPLSLAAGQTVSFDAEGVWDAAEGDRLVEVQIYRGETLQAACSRRVVVVQPEVEISLDAPELAGSRPFTVGLTIKNPGPFPLELDLFSARLRLARHLSLAPYESAVIYQEIALAADTELVVEVSGDVTRVVKKEILFGEKVEVGMPAGIAATTGGIPYRLANTGAIPAEVSLEFVLYRGGETVATGVLPFRLEVGETVEGVWPLALSPGEYHLTYRVSNKAGETDLLVLPDYAAELAVSSQEISPNELALGFTVRNTGYHELAAVLTLDADFAHLSLPVALAPGEVKTDRVFLHDLPLKPGAYPIAVALWQRGEVLARTNVEFVREEEVLPTAEMVVSGLPEGLVLGAGQANPVVIRVRNEGTKDGDAILEMVCDDYFAGAAVFHLAPGEETEAVFDVVVPEDYESGVYPAKLILNGEETAFTYRVEGYKLEATASLDKRAYRAGETASLTLRVVNAGGQPQVPLTVRVKHGDFDETREIVLAEEAVLEFALPAAPFGEKIFYGFYHAGTGRSLLMDVINIYEAFPEFTVTTEKDRYLAGETVYVNIETASPGWLAVAGPGDFHRFEEVENGTSYAIPLPASLPTGTYGIWVGFAGRTVEYRIDVLGKDVRFVSGILEGPRLQNGDPFRLDLLLTSREEFAERIVLELVKPDGGVLPLASREIALAAGENRLTFTGELRTELTGVHAFRVKILEGGTVLARQDFAFLCGEAELLAVETERQEYFRGEETVKGFVHLYGAGSGEVEISLDGRPVAVIPVTLSGATTAPFALEGLVPAPGTHIIAAVYRSQDGSSGRVTTSFVYGVGLPDLCVVALEVGKEPTAEGRFPVTVVVEKANPLPAEGVRVRVYQGAALIGEYTVERLEEEGALHN